jgi:hypothetical protein
MDSDHLLQRGEDMPGKLPIDRVRAAEDAPRIYSGLREG